MGFGLPLALVLGLFMGLVVLAHALRKGRAEQLTFPAAHLLIENPSAARTRQRVEDRWLMLLRMLLVAALALLAASPFVSCSRLSLTRTHGASLSVVIVIDDSASMQALFDGKSRLDRARDAARELVSDAQTGDAFALVLAGSPARVLLPSSADIGSVREALSSIGPSDRGTDIKGALTLARGLQAQVADAGQPVVLLSDLSGGDLDALDLSGVAVPDLGLTRPLSNCALARATWSEQDVLVEVICTDARAIAGRTLRLETADGVALGPELGARDGMLSLPVVQSEDVLAQMSTALVRLSRGQHDDIQSDDRTVVLSAPSKLSIAIHADLAKAGVKTASDTVLQSGLEALDRGLRVQPLSLLPDEATELSGYAALLIDDPSGFSPEVRNAIQHWVTRGGVAMVFLGPGLVRTPLGSNFLPFLDPMPSWVSQVTPGTPGDRPGPLGPLTATWSDLNAHGRAAFGSTPDLQILASWDDDSPLIASKALGQGLLLMSGLPSSVDVSDFVLRPAYLELLDHVVTQAHIRLGSAATPVGQRWRIAKGAVVRGRDGHRLEPMLSAFDPTASSATPGREREWVVEPDRAGVYRITSGDQHMSRYAILIPHEHIAQPRTDLSSGQSQARIAGRSNLGISREVALFVLLLSVIELLVRTFRREKVAQGASSLHLTTT